MIVPDLGLRVVSVSLLPESASAQRIRNDQNVLFQALELWFLAQVPDVFLAVLRSILELVSLHRAPLAVSQHRLSYSER